jgi:hypothetical protein
MALPVRHSAAGNQPFVPPQFVPPKPKPGSPSNGAPPSPPKIANPLRIIPVGAGHSPSPSASKRPPVMTNFRPSASAFAPSPARIPHSRFSASPPGSPSRHQAHVVQPVGPLSGRPSSPTPVAKFWGPHSSSPPPLTSSSVRPLSPNQVASQSIPSGQIQFNIPEGISTKPVVRLMNIEKKAESFLLAAPGGPGGSFVTAPKLREPTQQPKLEGRGAGTGIVSPQRDGIRQLSPPRRREGGTSPPRALIASNSIPRSAVRTGSAAILTPPLPPDLLPTRPAVLEGRTSPGGPPPYAGRLSEAQSRYQERRSSYLNGSSSAWAETVLL